MTAKRFTQYKGVLTSEQVVDGINAARRNAERLAADASLLLDSERYASAAALAILSIEETGKVPILRQLAVAKSEAVAKASWKAYRSHTSKNVIAGFLNLYVNGARKLNDFAPLFEKNNQSPHAIDELKQLSLYSDCIDNGQWAEPTTVITKEHATSAVYLANLLSKFKAVTLPEMELWVSIVGPNLNADNDTANNALADWYGELQLELTNEGENKMQRFVGEGNGDTP